MTFSFVAAGVEGTNTMLTLTGRRRLTIALLTIMGIAVLVGGFAVHVVYSESASSTHYKIISTDASGLGDAAGTTYKLYSTSGQSGANGVASSTNYQVQVGFVRRAFLDVQPPMSVGGIAESPNLTDSSGGGHMLGLIAGIAAFVLVVAVAGGWRILGGAGNGPPD